MTSVTATALDGIVVADFSRVLAGPYATMMLGDLGAQVHKVERPGVGDDTRRWGPPYADNGQSTYFQSINRNKDCLALDLHTDAGVSQARELIRRSDVVIENFKTGTMARLGLDYDTLAVDQPQLVYCSITGFGAKEGRDLPGYDLLVQAMGGLMSITGSAPGAPTKVGVALVDVLTGLHATVGILAALRHRDATGQGQYVEVNLLSSLLSGLVNQASSVVGAGVVPGILGNAHPSIAPYAVYTAADGPIVLAVGNDTQFQALMTELGVPGMSTDSRFATNPARVAHRDELTGVLNAQLATATSRQWQERLQDRGVPCGPINSIDQAMELAGQLGLEPAIDIAGVATVANPISLSKTPVTYRLAPPALPE